jgi:hypothetical protein
MDRASWAQRARVLLPALFTLAATISSACDGNPLSRKYEYEEDVYFALDGSATVYVNSSVPALVALRGVDLDVNPRARLDRARVRELFESTEARVASVTTSRRDNRRYVHLRIEVPDVSRLGAVQPFAWSEYAITRDQSVIKYRQTLTASAGRDVGNVGWTGAELVAVRLHLPSRVPWHNAPSRTIERGNIIVWEQLLSDRLRGQPLRIEAHMEPESILARTLMLFGSMILLAVMTFALVIWFVMRRGRPAAGAREQEAS